MKKPRGDGERLINHEWPNQEQDVGSGAKTETEKTQALEKGLSNKEVARKYNVPKNTISTWVKNKDKILSSLEEWENANWLFSFVVKFMWYKTKLFLIGCWMCTVKKFPYRAQ